LTIGAILAAASCARAAGPSGLAQSLVERAGFRNGLCVVIGADDGLPIELARASRWLVHVRDPQPAVVRRLQEQANRPGLSLQRLVVERGGIDSLPHAANLVDLVISTRGEALQRACPAKEILRALRPGGSAIIGVRKAADPAQAQRALTTWAAAGDASDTETWRDPHGVWIRFSRPALKGADDWSHWEKGPDNNPVSTDAVIQAPYMTQFMAGPYYIGMPSVTTAAGGRTFLAIGHIAHHLREWESLNRLIARNGYNGAVLWERSLPKGYLVHRSAFVAARDLFYMIDGDRCLVLDAATGQQRQEIRIPGMQGHWKWMAMKDGVLYVLAGKPGPGAQTIRGDREFGGWSWADLSRGYYGKRIPHGFGDTLAAYDLGSRKAIWTHREDTLIDSRGLAIEGDRLFLHCPGRHFRALDRKSGKPRWTNSDAKMLGLIEEPGRGLVSTPGWRTQTHVVATPRVLVIQGQTRMNVIGLSTDDGYLLWQKKKITNNPNAIYIDGKVVLGVGPKGSNVVIDPVSGTVEKDLKFVKRACTRLTASTDSLFCRGEGMTRLDRKSGKVLIDGAVRPGCNDGVIPANGLLYLGPWSCDCNLSLIGVVARCSAGGFKFIHAAKTSERLERSAATDRPIKPLEVTERDWATYRSDVHRTGGTPVTLPPGMRQQWHSRPSRPFTPTAPTAAGGLVFIAGDDGKARAIDAGSGAERWQFATAGVIKYPPTIWQGRAYVGSGDGYVYCLEAQTGRLLWRFNAAPIDRHIMVYGSLSSTWPVATGVMVHDGVAYFAAGIVDHDGTYVYAVDAKTGQVRWHNGTSGHLNRQLRKGVSVQGNLTVQDNKLVLAGGNVISPAVFDLATGKCLSEARPQGQPQSNGGRFVGVYQGKSIISGGRILYSSPRNVSTKGSFVIQPSGRGRQTLTYGGITPAWDGKALVTVSMRYGAITVFDADKVKELLFNPKPASRKPSDRRRNLAGMLSGQGKARWQAGGGSASKFEAVSLVVCPNAVLAVAKYQDAYRAHPQWHVIAYRALEGKRLFQQPLRGEPLPGGLLVTRHGRAVVTMLNGDVVCYGQVPKPQAADAPKARQRRDAPVTDRRPL